MDVSLRKIFKDEGSVEIVAEIIKASVRMKANRVEIEALDSEARVNFYISGLKEVFAVFPLDKKDEVFKRIEALAGIPLNPSENKSSIENNNGLFMAKINEYGIKKTFFITKLPAGHYEERMVLGLNWGEPNKYEIDE